jgi:hypothetical protein
VARALKSTMNLEGTSACFLKGSTYYYNIGGELVRRIVELFRVVVNNRLIKVKRSCSDGLSV